VVQGNEGAIEKWISPDYVHKDNVWVRTDASVLVLSSFFAKLSILELRKVWWQAPSELVVGQKRFKDLVKSTRKAYPDYFVEITEVGVCDMHRLFVMWQGKKNRLASLELAVWDRGRCKSLCYVENALRYVSLLYVMSRTLSSARIDAMHLMGCMGPNTLEWYQQQRVPHVILGLQKYTRHNAWRD
jgi:hypothetical protein